MDRAAIAARLEQFAAVWSTGNADSAAALFADDATYGEPPRFSFTGRDALHRFFADFFARHSAVAFVIERTVIDPDERVAALSWTFSHTRTAQGHHLIYQGMSFIDFTPEGLISSWRGVSLPG